MPWEFKAIGMFSLFLLPPDAHAMVGGMIPMFRENAAIFFHFQERFWSLFSFIYYFSCHPSLMYAQCRMHQEKGVG